MVENFSVLLEKSLFGDQLYNVGSNYIGKNLGIYLYGSRFNLSAVRYFSMGGC